MYLESHGTYGGAFMIGGTRSIVQRALPDESETESMRYTV